MIGGGTWLSRIADLRSGEGRTLTRAAGALFLIMAGHTMLETARDGLLLARLSPRDLGAVYVVVALAVFPAATLSARLAPRIGVRRVLNGGLALAALALGVLFLLPSSAATAVALYVATGVIGAVLVPLYWNHLAGVLTVAQGRRLLAPIAAAGTLGATAGSGGAALLLGATPVVGLLLVSASALLFAILALPRATLEDASRRNEPEAASHSRSTGWSMSVFRSEPFVLRIALLAATSTLAVVAVDFFFKWTISRAMPHDGVARFIARAYAAFSMASLVAQLLASRKVVDRLGLAWAVTAVPLVIMGGSMAVLGFGASLVSVVALKALDVSTRLSVHRMTMELLYLPLPPLIRMRAKPVVDGALVRVVQGGAGIVLLGLGMAGRFSAVGLTLAVLVLAGLWFEAARTTRTPYMALLRRNLAPDSLAAASSPEALDLASVETLIEHLSHEDPLAVVGAMSALSRRGRARLIPGLILLHEHEAVLVRALAIFGASSREDWIDRGRKLLADPREPVRTAAARALAAHKRLDAADLAADASPRLRGYAALHLALESEADLSRDPALAAIIGQGEEEGREGRLGLLSAVADAAPNERLLPLLEVLAASGVASRLETGELARAAMAQRATSLVPVLVARLTQPDAREAVRAALVSFGDDAFADLERALHASDSPKALRIQLPDTIARFGTKRAAELLLETVENDFDGLVRYKAVRALGRLVADRGLKVDRARLEQLALRNLLEFFRLLGLRAALDPTPLHLRTGRTWREPTAKILVGLLNDKLRQSIERTFRLLKIAYPHEDIHRVHFAYLSEDAAARANAAEFLDGLLRRRGQRRLADLLRIGAEEANPKDALERARGLLDAEPVATGEEALHRLMSDRDATVSALARLHADAVAGRASRVVLSSRDRAPVSLALPPAA